ncbi:hypothetical protein MNBD_CHLOROFLEXI01-2937 [hydrothermal vent metagenome]|uniref:Uncharacterized protein n=1 Tax=hydrothermal vent metagenome TaxID=652676 RepID=A0A3B0VDK1_9ZZZZ
MIRGNISHLPVADVEISSLLPDQMTRAILNFLELWLPAFRAEYLTQFSTLLLEDKKEAKREDGISKFLLQYLLAQAKETNLSLQFNEKKGVDFFIFIGLPRLHSKPIFVIEAKRLPSSNDGKQYVVGTDRADGIERFKCEQEGFIFDKNHCAMVAYVQRQTFEYWFERINRWLIELIADNENYDGFDWEKSDKLVKIASNSDDVARYISKHSRKTLSRLTINHFWLDMHIDNPA